MDSKRNFVSVKIGNKVALPRNPEQLRFRIDLWGRSWIFAAALHTNRTELTGLVPPVFTNYGNHMLGEHVLGLLSDGPLGDMIDSNLWIKLLDYELEERKDAMNRMEDGTPLVKALAQAIKDPEVKMKFFTDPVQFRKRVTQENQQQGSSSSAGDLQTGAGWTRPRPVKREQKKYSASSWAAWTQQTKGAGKGKGAKGAGKGKGQGKGAKGKAQCKSHTPPLTADQSATPSTMPTATARATVDGLMSAGCVSRKTAPCTAATMGAEGAQTLAGTCLSRQRWEARTMRQERRGAAQVLSRGPMPELSRQLVGMVKATARLQGQALLNPHPSPGRDT